MMSFPRFIIDQGLASEGDVLDALVASIASQPTLCSIVHDQKLLTPNDQLRVIEHQSSHKSSYKQALIDLGLWNETIEKAINEQNSKLATPFSTILLSKKVIDFPTIIRAFDEFVATANTDIDNSHATNQHKKNSQEIQSPSSSNHSIDDFANSFDLARYGLMTSMINDWNSFTPDSRAQVIHALIGEWDAIRMIAVEIGASEAAALLEAGIYMLQNNSSNGELISSGQLAHLTTIALNVTHIAWALRERIVKSRSLKLTTEDSALKFRYETILSAVRTIRAAA